MLITTSVNLFLYTGLDVNLWIHNGWPEYDPVLTFFFFSLPAFMNLPTARVDVNIYRDSCMDVIVRRILKRRDVSLGGGRGGAMTGGGATDRYLISVFSLPPPPRHVNICHPFL